MAEYDYSPWTGARDVAGIESANLTNRKMRQEISDFLARREALRAFGDEPVINAPGYQRSSAMRGLYAATPEAAMELEQKQLAPGIEARKAGEVERAKRQADLEVLNAMAGRFGGDGGGGGGMTSYGMRSGQPFMEFDRTKTEELGLKRSENVRQEKELINSRIEKSNAGIEKAWTDYNAGVWGQGPAAELKRNAVIEQHEAVRDQNAMLLNEIGRTRGGRMPSPAQEPLVKIMPGYGGEEPAAAATPPPPPAPTRVPSQSVQPAAAPTVPTRAQQEETAAIGKEKRGEQQSIRGEQRKQFEEYIYKDSFATATPRAAMAANVLPRLLELQNENQFGEPLLKIPYAMRLKAMGSNEAAEFEQGFMQLGQGMVQQGTSGSLNTQTEMDNFLRAQGGLTSTPKMNANTIVALLNGKERGAVRSEFFQILQKEGLTVAESDKQWRQYVKENAPYVVQEQGKANERKRYVGIRNPDFQSPTDWLKGGSKKSGGKREYPTTPSDPDQLQKGKVYQSPDGSKVGMWDGKVFQPVGK